MISQSLIDEVRKRLVKTYKPREIYIFGSYAWGTPNRDSDLDLLIVIDHYQKDLHSLLVEGHKVLIDLDLSKDIIIYTKEEFDRFSKDRLRFCYKVKNEGQQIYAAKA